MKRRTSLTVTSPNNDPCSSTKMTRGLFGTIRSDLCRHKTSGHTPHALEKLHYDFQRESRRDRHGCLWEYCETIWQSFILKKLAWLTHGQNFRPSSNVVSKKCCDASSSSPKEPPGSKFKSSRSNSCCVNRQGVSKCIPWVFFALSEKGSKCRLLCLAMTAHRGHIVLQTCQYTPPVSGHHRMTQSGTLWRPSKPESPLHNSDVNGCKV